MIKITTWKPDTCGCVLEYEWDDTQPENARVHTFRGANIKCTHHQYLVDNTHWNQVLDENQTKNKIHGLLLENFPNLVDIVTEKNGEIVKKFKPNIEYKWAFDINRKLEVEIIGGSIADKTKLKDLSDTKIGLNKIKII